MLYQNQQPNLEAVEQPSTLTKVRVSHIIQITYRPSLHSPISPRAITTRSTHGTKVPSNTLSHDSQPKASFLMPSKTHQENLRPSVVPLASRPCRALRSDITTEQSHPCQPPIPAPSLHPPPHNENHPYPLIKPYLLRHGAHTSIWHSNGPGWMALINVLDRRKGYGSTNKGARVFNLRHFSWSLGSILATLDAGRRKGR